MFWRARPKKILQSNLEHAFCGTIPHDDEPESHACYKLFNFDMAKSHDTSKSPTGDTTIIEKQQRCTFDWLQTSTGFTQGNARSEPGATLELNQKG